MILRNPYAVTEYARAHGYRPTCRPGVWRRRCLGCDSPLHREPGPVFHARRIVSEARDERGRWCDPCEAWKMARRATERKRA